MALVAGGACSHSSEKSPRRYRRFRRRYIGSMREPGFKLRNLLVSCFSELLKFIRKLVTIPLKIVDVPFWAFAVPLSFGASKPLQI